MLLAVLLFIAIKAKLYVRISNEIQAAQSGEVCLEQGIYQGDLYIGFPQGEGTLRFNTGETYSGNWDANTISGVGTLEYPNSGKYEGNFENGLKCGYGTFTWLNGDVYAGNWASDQMCGEGVYTFADGGVLNGTFSENQFVLGAYDYQAENSSFQIQYLDGKTQTITAVLESGVSYTGGYLDCQIAGYGEMDYPNGDMYAGEYEDGVRCGTGTYTWKIGNQYNGNWSSDTMNGEGTYTFSSGETLQGTFQSGTFLSGTYTTKDENGNYSFTIKNKKTVGAKFSFTGGISYEGAFDGEHISGHGIITYTNGDQYEGSLEDGLRSGQGVYSWHSGEKYDGHWVQDTMEGTGTYYYRSSDGGIKLTGTFTDGLPNGDCQYYLTEFLSYKTSWKNGKCMKVYE